MTNRLRRTLAVLAAVALTGSGVAFTATSASALPATVAFSEQTCDIPVGDDLVDGIDLTITNSEEVDQELQYSIVLDFAYATPYEVGTIAAGDDERVVIPRPEGSSTTVQVFNTAEGGGLFAGALIDVNCGPDYSPEAVGSIQPASCAFPTGGIIPPSPGFSFTLDNSEGEGPAAYAFVAGDVPVESGTVAPGETRVRAWSLEEDTPLVATVSSVDAEGEPVVLAESTEEVNCEADTPVLTAPADGSDVNSPVTIGGTGTAGDQIRIVVGDETVITEPQASGFLAAAEPAVPVEEGEGFAVYETTVQADNTFAISVELEVGAYGAAAIASRAASEDGLVPASVSEVSNIVLFDVIAVVPPTPPSPPAPAPNPGVPSAPTGNGGSLANTGATPLAAGGAGLLLLLAGGASVLLLRRRRTA
jgi:hypothetical protein